jgi:putative ABC transport system substrate-binding protein
MFAFRENVEVGGLIMYAARVADLSRRAAFFVDRILKGARPSELPIEQPTTFELIINLKTTKILGLTLPPTLLAQVDEVIE